MFLVGARMRYHVIDIGVGEREVTKELLESALCCCSSPLPPG